MVKLNDLTEVRTLKLKKNIFKKSAKVQWVWMGRSIEGQIEEVHVTSISKTIKTKKITRHGTAENPAYLVKSAAGNLALKLGSELEARVNEKKSSKSPRLFSS